MTDFFCTKYKMPKGYALVPAHQTDEEVLAKLPVGQPLRVKVTRMRNVGHHRRYFALLNYAYDIWEPPISEEAHYHAAAKALEPEKNFDRFRSDIIIKAGFSDAYYRINGDIRIEPKSIAFGNMDQAEFDELYDKTITVIVKHVLSNYTADDLRRVIDQVMEFDS